MSGESARCVAVGGVAGGRARVWALEGRGYLERTARFTNVVATRPITSPSTNRRHTWCCPRPGDVAHSTRSYAALTVQPTAS